MRLAGQLIGTLEGAKVLDRPSGWVNGLAHKVLPDGGLKNALSGSWLGHPLHPALVAGPFGILASVPLLDSLRADSATRRRLVGLGLLGAVPAIAAGLADWSDTTGAEQRVGAVHALANAAGLAAFARSWWARRDSGSGGASAMVGLVLMSVGGWLGGHLAYALGVGVDTTAFQVGPQEWTGILDEDELGRSELVSATAAGVGLVAARTPDGEVRVLANRCTHRGGPLSEGELDGVCVRCPWHGSTFALADGEVVRGPAVRPQPAYGSRTVGGRIEVRRSEARSLRTNSA